MLETTAASIEASINSMDPDHEIDLDALPFFRTFKSGRVERLFGTDVVPASFHPATAVTSKDVLIDPTINLSARLYLPSLSDEPSKKIPILVYFHGGAFVFDSASSPLYHNYLNPLSAKAAALIVSVDYRLAPEHPLPAAHDDSWAALKWVVSHSAGTGPEPWLAQHGDFSRLSLAGDSAGGNLAHHTAVRAGAEAVMVNGLAFIHGYFTVKGSELMSIEAGINGLVCKGSAEGEKLLQMPTMGGLKAMGCKRVMVFVAEEDVGCERQKTYYDGLVASEWGGEAELVETKGEGHVFHLHKPEAENAVVLMEKFAEFLNRD